MFERTPYLSRKAFSFYFSATIITILSTNAGLVILGIIVGQMLGAQAMAVMNLTFPLVQFIYTLSLLFNLGNAIMASYLIGKSDEKRASQHFTLAMFLNLIVGLVFVVLGLFYSKELSHMLCTENELIPMLSGYVKITLFSAPLQLLVPGLCMFSRSNGAPKLAARTLGSTTILSILLTFLFIKYCDWGINSAALAVMLSYIVASVFMLQAFVRKTSILKFQAFTKGIHFKSAFVSSLPSVLTAALTTFRLFAINQIVGMHIGVFGLEILAVVLNYHILATIFTNGTAQAIQPLGAFLLGQNDNLGFRFVAKRAFKYLFYVMLCCVAVFTVFTENILELFGFDFQEHLQQAKYIIRIVAFSYLIYAFNYILMTIFQISLRNKFSIFISSVQPLLLIPILWFFADLSTEHMWWSFVLSELIVLALILIISFVIKTKEKNKSYPFLLPKYEARNCLSLTVKSSNVASMERLSVLINTFLADNNVEESTKLRAEKCFVNLIKYINQNSPTTGVKMHIDLNITVTGNELKFVSADNAHPDLTNKNKENLLKLFVDNDYSVQVYHKYMNGQNLRFASIQRECVS